MEHLADDADDLFLSDPYYKYEPLQEGHIRLLKIDDISDGWDEQRLEYDFSVSLFTVPAHSCPEYDTLSYTWGDPNPPNTPKPEVFTTVERCYPIYSAGRILRGTRNLRHALGRLRQMQSMRDEQIAQVPSGVVMRKRYGKAQFYWIDSLCVNQDDLNERKEQVLLMGKIFMRAQVTFVWLGETSKDSKLALQVMAKLAATLIDAEFETNMQSMTSPKELKSLNDLTHEESRAAMALLDRDWFKRVWTLQEAILSRTAVAVWGSVCVPFDIILVAGQVISKSGGIIRLISRGLGDRDSFPNFRVNELSQVTEKFRAIIQAQMTIDEGRMIGFHTFVSLCNGSKSTDLRDRIYGFLAITEEFNISGHSGITPDYQRTVGEVYTAATSAIICKRNDLHVLACCCDPSERVVKHLPSWCPDYSVVGTVATRIKSFLDEGQQWHMTRLWSASPMIDLHQSMLGIEGVHYDVIHKTGKPLTDCPSLWAPVLILFQLAFDLKVTDSVSIGLE